MCRIAVNLDIEDMPAASELVVRSLYLRLELRRAVVVDRHMVGVGVVLFVGHSFDDAVFLPVHLGELTGKAFCRRRKDRVVMLVLLTVTVDLIPHMSDNP